MINLLFTGNYKMFDGILIASLSILKHTEKPITCYVLTMNLTMQNDEYAPIDDVRVAYLNDLYKSVNSSSKVIKLDATDIFLKSLNDSPNKENFYTPFAFLRLFIDKFKEVTGKILYLDTDVILNDDVSLLYDVDVNDYEVAWVKDYYGKRFLSKNYCNSGVMLINVDKIRKTKLFEKSLLLCSNKKMFLADQTAINKTVSHGLILPDKFNEQKKLKNDTVIRHFSMTLKFFPRFKKQNVKPWNVEEVHSVLKTFEFDDILNDYLNRKQNFKF